jgi:hypothetical protein
MGGKIMDEKENKNIKILEIIVTAAILFSLTLLLFAPSVFGLTL